MVNLIFGNVELILPLQQVDLRPTDGMDLGNLGRLDKQLVGNPLD
jgi:hypothetical protein